MSLANVDFVYRYERSSQVATDESQVPSVQLATSSVDSHPKFLNASLIDPVTFAESLLCLSTIVRTHYFLPISGLLDPVVTCGEGALRFEGFSGCVGVYVQCIFRESAFCEPILGRGTTNVDINDELRNGLARIQASQQVRLAVGADKMAIDVDDQQYVEKKVKLPVRWLRGFCEVQAYLTKASRCIKIPANEMLRFVRGLPRNAARSEPLWAFPSGKSLRLTSRSANSAIRIAGTERLRSLEPLLRRGKGHVTIWNHAESGVSVWSLDVPTCQFLIALSPELYRGFSGEGQVLGTLANTSWQNAIDQVKASLKWQGSIAPDTLHRSLGLPLMEIRAALDALATRGLVGFDPNTDSYFHRELPFHSDLIETLQPRLLAARKLLAENAVLLHKTISESETEWLIRGSSAEHLVRLSIDQDRCTCVWFSKNQGQRGPCKHVLAARMKLSEEPQ